MQLLLLKKDYQSVIETLQQQQKKSIAKNQIRNCQLHCESPRSIIVYHSILVLNVYLCDFIAGATSY